MKENFRFLIFNNIFTFIFLIWICYYYKYACTFRESGKNNQKLNSKIFFSNCRSLMEYDLGSKYKTIVSKKVIPRNGSNDILKNIKGSNSNNEKLKKIPIENVKGNNLPKKKTCSIFKCFKNIDSFYEKKILKLINLMYKHGNNRNRDVIISRIKALNEIVLMFLPYVLFCIIMAFSFSVNHITQGSLFLFIFGYTVTIYIFVKVKKYCKKNI
ncbi:Plasmodium exported protein, unknown function [Plasmodium ovale]|uniref:Uncharacterized protein n=1 Tax=Plasmodium ovale TaxID=36330 RepID=A0A1D3JFU0_PLAOA|nr:Plasmodium exported protein, unknown function [Plasmodium ovale]